MSAPPDPVPAAGGLLRQGIRPFFSSGLVAAAFPPALRMAGAALQFLATVWIARALGEDGGAGFFFWSAMIMSFAGFTTFGLDKLALQQVPRLHQSPKALASFLGSTRAISTSLALAAGLLLAAYAYFFDHDPNRSTLWYALLPASLIGLVLCKVNTEAMKGLGHPLLAVNWRNIIPASIFLLALVAFGSTLSAGSALFCFAAGFAAAGFASSRSRAFGMLPPSPRLPRPSEAKQQIAAGLPICTGAVLNALNYMVPLIILESFHPGAEVSFLTTAYRVFVLFELLAAAVHSISMPSLSRAAHGENWKRCGEIYGGSIRYGLAVLFLPMVAGIILADPLMAFFGEGFSEAGGTLITLLSLGLVSLTLGPADDLILMMGKTRRLAIYTGINLLLTAILGIFVIPAYGALGMAALFGAGIVFKKSLCLAHFIRHSRSAEGNR